MAVNGAQPATHLLFGSYRGGHDILICRRLQPLTQRIGPGSFRILENRDVSCVEDDHGPAWARSSSRMRCPASMISFMMGSPANIPSVLFQSSRPGCASGGFV